MGQARDERIHLLIGGGLKRGFRQTGGRSGVICPREDIDIYVHKAPERVGSVFRHIILIMTDNTGVSRFDDRGNGKVDGQIVRITEAAGYHAIRSLFAAGRRQRLNAVAALRIAEFGIGGVMTDEVRIDDKLISVSVRGFRAGKRIGEEKPKPVSTDRRRNRATRSQTLLSSGSCAKTVSNAIYSKIVALRHPACRNRRSNPCPFPVSSGVRMNLARHRFPFGR